MSILIVIGISITAFIGLILVYLTVVIFGPGFHVTKQPLELREPTTDEDK